MTLHIKIFGRLAELMGSSALEIEAVENTDELYKLLYQNYPALKEVKFFIALNNKMIKSNTIIDSQATVALLPPFSGG